MQRPRAITTWRSGTARPARYVEAPMRRSLLGFALTAAISVAAAACGGGSRPLPGAAPSTLVPAGTERLAAQGVAPAQATAAAVGQAVAAEQVFALDLAREVGTTGGNVVVSPSSLDTALAMLLQGAGGQTAAQIVDALHGQGPGASDLGLGWGAALRQLQQVATTDGQTLSEADELWADKSLSVRQGFLQTLAADFATGMAEADFARAPAGAASAVNRWVAQHTDGHITQLFDAHDLAQAELVMADAVYLHATWDQPFDSRNTAPAPWHPAPGRTEQVPTMEQPNSGYAVSVTPSLTAAELPYQGSHLAALALMPPGGQLATFEQQLTPAALAGVIAGLQDRLVDLRIPKFHFRSTLDLEPTLQALGVRDAFTAAANFRAVSATPLFVSKVKQVADIAVDEKGTTAAAATGVVGGATAPAPGPRPLAVTLDHPFLLLLRDTATGAVLFTVQVADPSVS